MNTRMTPEDEAEYDALHAEYVDDDRPGETPEAALVRRVQAAFAMSRLDAKYEVAR